MRVDLGAVGSVAMDGRLYRNQDPAFLSDPADMQGHAVPGSAYSDTVIAIDPDLDPLEYVLLQGPVGMTLTDSVLAWIPDSASGDTFVSVAVRDAKGGADTLSWTVSLLRSRLAGIISSDRVLSKSEGPFWVDGNVLVESGVSLNLEPGVHLRFGPGFSLQVNGTLNARGSESDSIVFTTLSSESPAWGRILFTNTAADAAFDSAGAYVSGSVLEYCRIEKGGSMVEAMIQAQDANPWFHRIRVAGSKSIGMSIVGGPRVERCAIVGNRVRGISFSTSRWTGERGLIRASRIDSNASGIDGAASYGGGVFLMGPVDLVDDTLRANGELSTTSGGAVATECCMDKHLISGNLIEGNSGYSNAAGNFGDDSLMGNTIRGNRSLHVSVLGMTYGVLIGNRIEGNSVVNTESSGYTSIIALSGTHARNNSIIGNHSSIGPSAAVLFNGMSGNPFSGNNLSNPSLSYEARNFSGSQESPVNAEGNWWGVSVESEIAARVFDWFDDGARGLVDYSPFLTAPAPGAPAP
jgi:hypothetical protein